jgi:hypothetical protein
MIEANHPPVNPDSRFLPSIVLLTFLGGSLCFFPFGFWFGAPLLILGMAAVISAI